MHAPSRRLVFSRRLLALLAVLLVPLFLAVPPHLRQDPLIGPLADRYHVGLFLVLTVLFYRWGPLAGRPVAVVLGCLALGGATELLQVLAGRSATFWDWYQDALGVGLGACWIWWRRSGKSTAPILGVIVLLALVAWPLRHLPVTVRASRAAEARFPLLDDFEHPDAIALWSGHQGEDITLVPVAGRGMVLQMSSHGDERWPGVSSRRLPYDWSEYTTLTVTCRLVAPSPDSLRVSIWCEDRADRYDSDYAFKSFVIGHQWRTVTVSLTDLITDRRGRALSLGEIQGFAVYASRRRPGPVVLQVDDLRLGIRQGGG